MPEQRCTDDLTHCISLANYIPDVCRTIEEAAGKNALDPNFFARLLWKESLFDAGAVSPAGAQGIAQFMPETARLRGLDDTFNPATALYASANYLSELSRDFGNLGLAAAAYNGGEARVERFIAKEGSLPLETRAYVQAITGHPIETWRDDPPTELDLSLEATGTFQGHASPMPRTEACASSLIRNPSCPGESSSHRIETATERDAKSRACRTGTQRSLRAKQ